MCRIISMLQHYIHTHMYCKEIDTVREREREMSGTQTVIAVMSIVAALGVLGWILFAFKIGPSYGLNFNVATVKVRFFFSPKRS